MLPNWLRRGEAKDEGSSGGAVSGIKRVALFRKPEAAPAPVKAVQKKRPPAVAPANDANKPEASEGSGSGEVIEHLAGLPTALRTLTSGEDALYKLPAAISDKLMALDLGTKRAIIVRIADASDEHYEEVLAHLKSLKGELRAKGYRVGPDLLATTAVMRDALRNKGVRTKGNGNGRPLELFNSWIELAVRYGATDMHVWVKGNIAEVRCRIDGALEPLRDGMNPPGVYPRQDAIDAISAAYNDTRKGANNSQYDEDKFVDCMYDFDNAYGTGQLRYQNLKGRMGPAVVVRILKTESGTPLTFDRAGYAESHLRLWKLASRAGKGMIIVSGVTGSGKSTSMKTFIETMPGLEQKAIFTVEDPIEYAIFGSHQIEVLRDLTSEEETKRRYGAVMKALMRADLDGALVGEIRDRLTAGFALQIAETGHLAMGTLHAHLISNIVPRLTNQEVGLSRDALTSPNILNLLVYQYLVAKVCPHCGETPAVAMANDPEVREYVDILQGKFKVSTDQLRFKHIGGCEKCDGRGTKGKTVVAEMWQPDRKWLGLIRENDDYGALMHYRSFSDRDFHSPNMTGKTVFEHTLWKALQGLVDPRSCEDFDTFERFEILGE